MGKKNKNLLIALIVILLLISVALIIMFSIKNKKDDKNSIASTKTTTEEINENENEREETEIENTEEVIDENPEEGDTNVTEEIDENPEGISTINYTEDIKETVKNADNNLIVNGEKISIPCKFNDIKDKFDFVEKLPDMFEKDGYLEIHAKDKGDGHSLGVSFMIVDMKNESNYNLNDSYITHVAIDNSQENISCYGLKYGSSKKELETFINQHDWEYVTSDYDVTTSYFFSVDERMGFSCTYDYEEECITYISISYTII